MKKLVLLILIGFFANNILAQKTVDKRLAGIDTLINRLLSDWHAAGCAVAVVEKNKIVYLKGYGFKDYAKRSPVTENTQFAIGSCSKAFTASLLGMLEKEGKLDLDKPVQEYFPELRFNNENLTSYITARDMMTHRTGLPRHDYSWYGATTTRDSLIYRIRYLEPSAPLRQRWQYNNFMFLAQGVLAEKLYGKSWETLVKEKILAPLEMNNSNFSVNDLQKSPDFTYGYREEKDSVIKMEFINIDPIGPAGSINSSAKDMANWVMAWINGGKFKDKEIIPAAYLNQAIAAQMVVPGGLPSKDLPDVYGSNYGLGWFIGSHRGHYLVQHGGNIDGFSANTSFYPSDSIGIVVLTNQNGSPLPSMIRSYIADRMLGLSARNWSKLVKDVVARNKKAQLDKSNADSANRKTGTKPSHELKAYAGRFSNPGYGTVTTELKNDTLWLEYNNSNGKLYLQHYHYDIFNIKSKESGGDDDEPTKFRFITDNKGEISSIESSLEPSVKDIVFTRLPPLHLITRNELEKYLGEYELNSVVVKVFLRGENTLMLLVPGQPDYELVATKPNEFELKNIKGFSVRFELDSSGKSIAAHFNQPNGVFKATRKK